MLRVREARVVGLIEEWPALLEGEPFVGLRIGEEGGAVVAFIPHLDAGMDVKACARKVNRSYLGGIILNRTNPCRGTSCLGRLRRGFHAQEPLLALHSAGRAEALVNIAVLGNPVEPLPCQAKTCPTSSRT